MSLDPRRILSFPAVYRALQNLVGGEAVWRSYISEIMELRAGERMLDLGCGPGTIVPWLPDVEYHGVDADAEYISDAQSLFAGARRSFHHRNISRSVADDLGKFDIVAATGVLHHLDDDTAHALFECARNALKPGGRLVTCDGVRGERASLLARALVASDRGGFVRTRSGYEALARNHFDSVAASVRRDLSRVPYVHCVLVCRAHERRA